MTTAAPRVSVICAWYDRADYVLDTIGGILGQTFADFELIVVNDGSKDPRVQTLLESFTDSRMRIVQHSNEGFTKSIIKAIAQSRGEYIAMHDAGDQSTPDRLRTQVEYLDANPDIVGVSAGRRNVRLTPSGTHELISEIVPQSERLTRLDFLNHIGSPINHGEVMFRRSMYEKVGGYRPVFYFSQDMDLWLRLTRHGDFGVQKAILLERRIFPDGVKGNLLKTVASLKFSRMAKACAREVDAFGYDMVDVFGMQAQLFRAHDKDCSNDLAKAALKYLRNGHSREAVFLARLARRENVGVLALMASVLATGSRLPLFRDLAIWLASLLPIRDLSETTPFLDALSRK